MSGNRTYKKLVVTTVTPDFRKAVETVTCDLKEPEAKQVLVKNLYAGVNATDINITAARYFTDGKTPFDIGFEGLGTVEQIGSEVEGFIVGQPVLYMGSSGYAEYIYATKEQLIPVPDARPEFLVTMVNGLTASIGLDVAGRIKSDETVLITAAAGGTGHIAVQWAKAKGCHVIGTTSSDEKADFLRSIGADKVINYKTEDLDAALTRDYPNGVDVIWETIGGKTFEMLLNHLAPKGRMVVIGGITGYKDVGFPEVGLKNLAGKLVFNSLTIAGFLVMSETEKFPEYLTRLITDIVVGKLTVKYDTGVKTEGGEFKGLQDAVRGVEHLHSGKNEGKVIVPLV
jgi:NADPH-dependent curcumin reductase CurA